jgi:hypothetical protein
VFGDRPFDGLHRDRAVGFVRCQLDQVGFRIETMEADMRFHRVAVGRESAGFHQDRRALAGRAVEADQHQVEVDAERVHRHHFRRQRADHAGQLLGHQAVVVHPAGRAGEVAFHRMARPQVQYLLHHCLGAARLQAE